MLPVKLETFRLFLHVLAASVWVGGQLTLAGLVPGLRQISEDAPRVVARRFNRIAWPAFGVAVATGIWNLFEVDVGKTSSEYQVTLALKVGIVTLSGVGAALHAASSSRKALAAWGAVSGATALGALFFGLLLRS